MTVVGSFSRKSSVTSGKEEFTRDLLTSLGSIIYAVLLVILASFFYLLDLTRKTDGLHQAFNDHSVPSFTEAKVCLLTQFPKLHRLVIYERQSCPEHATGQISIFQVMQSLFLSFETSSAGICGIGIVWLIFLHWDIQQYKMKLLKKMRPRGMSSVSTNPLHSSSIEDIEVLSTSTEMIFFQMNGGRHLRIGERPTSMGSPSLPAYRLMYRFLKGRHTASFYLKCGMAAFCFGHIIHEGLRCGHQIYYFAIGDVTCQSLSELVLYTIRPVFSFYQLFMIFKYSNVVIDRCKQIAHFGLMHLIGASIAFWIGTIVDDALDFYVQHHLNDHYNVSNRPEETFLMDAKAAKDMECSDSFASSVQSSKIMPYMYPFSIEYNLCLAVLWYLVWNHIGKECGSGPHRETVSQDLDGNEMVAYESNLVIRADCHASNKGLFAGLFVMLFSLVAMFMFFISLQSEPILSLYVLHTQELLLAGLLLLCTLCSYWHTCQFHLLPHQPPTLDAILLMIPMPCFFVNNLLAVTAEMAHGNYWRSALLALITLQVVFQTVFIIDAMHRSFHFDPLRFQKPGREFITFAVLLNLTSWIVYTFEIRASEQFFSETLFYGETLWMIVSHTTLPLMLFYRFHASVCLADVWKFAYEKPHHSVRETQCASSSGSGIEENLETNFQMSPKQWSTR